MKDKSTAWWELMDILKAGPDDRRWMFWGWVMDYFPRFYKWADKHLPFDTLPF